MNLGMIRRAIDRHRLMKERAPYTEFVELVAARRDVWCTTQSDFARWWIAREDARVDIRIEKPGVIEVSSSLPEAAVAVDADVRRGPTIIECATDFDPKHLALVTRSSDRFLIAAILKHLGAGHVELRTGDSSPLSSAHAQIDEYLQHRTAARAYPPAVVEEVRRAVTQIHHEAGVPNLSIWPLPLSESGIAYRVAFSPRFDVDKAIVNVPLITELHCRFEIRGTFYLRVTELFYGDRDIQHLASLPMNDELALHGEFVTTAEKLGGDESAAALEERNHLERLLGRQVDGVCTHGGELRANQTDRTPIATDAAGFVYETTFYPREYYHPMFVPSPDGLRSTLTMLRHDDDVSLLVDEDFHGRFVQAFTQGFEAAERAAGIYVPCMHPLYFDLKHYLSHTKNVVRLVGVLPLFLSRAARLKRGHRWENQDKLHTQSVEEN